MEYEYFMPARVLGGREAVRRNAALLSRFGKSCLLVTGRRSALASGAQQDIAAALESQGIRWQVFAQIGENPYLEDCRRAAEQCRACGAEFVVGIGGGSPMDAAKAVAVLAVNPGLSTEDFYAGNRPNRALPIVLVGTTSGTGSEVSGVSVLALENGVKKSVKGEDMYAALAFADPKYTFSMSRAETISTGLDALAHAMEGYFSPQCDPVSGAMAELAMPSLWKDLCALRRGEELTEEMHARLYEGSIQAGLVLNTLGTSFPHPLGYVLTERFRIPHGRACAVFEPSLLRRVLEQEPARGQRFLQLLSCTEEEFSQVVLDLAGCGGVAMQEEEIRALEGRFTHVKNYANVPGGFGAADALAVFRRLFGRKTRILLVRHCESQGNGQGIFQGHIDCDVSENGKKQLELLSLRLRNWKLDAIVSSPLLRARRTAEAVNQYHHLPIEINEDLIEIDAGEYNGKLWADLPRLFPEETSRWYRDPGSFSAPGGESMRQVYDRAWRGLLQVAQSHRGQTVCVVSHGSAMRCILCRAMGKPLEELGQVPWCENTGLNLLEFEEDGSVRVVYQNDASHLTPETASMAKQSWWQI